MFPGGRPGRRQGGAHPRRVGDDRVRVIGRKRVGVVAHIGHDVGNAQATSNLRLQRIGGTGGQAIGVSDQVPQLRVAQERLRNAGQAITGDDRVAAGLRTRISGANRREADTKVGVQACSGRCKAAGGDVADRLSARVVEEAVVLVTRNNLRREPVNLGLVEHTTRAVVVEEDHLRIVRDVHRALPHQVAAPVIGVSLARRRRIVEVGFNVNAPFPQRPRLE